MRNRQAEFVKHNVRPKDYRSRRNGGHDNKGDCTTRCIVTCLEGRADYREIEAEQYRLAKRLGTYRNTTGTWDRILTQNGFEWLQLNKLKSRANIANFLSTIESPIASLSSSHVCAIQGGKVLDTWDSRGGRVYGLCVKSEDIDEVQKLLSRHGINAKLIDCPRRQIKRRKHRYW